MKPIVVTREIAAPAETVWATVTDLDRAEENISGIEKLERLAGPEFGVGTRWRETRTMFGKEATEEMEVTAIDPGDSYRVEAASHGAHYISEISVTGRGPSASTLEMSFDAEPQGTVTRIMGETIGRLFRGGTRKALQQDLDDIAAAAEARS